MPNDKIEPLLPAPDAMALLAPLDSRARLIEIATGLFRRAGVRAASVDDIVDATGLSKPTFYRRFATKDALVVACLVQEGRRVRDELTDLLRAVDTTLATRVRAIGGYYAAAFDAVPRRGLFALNLAVEYPDAEGEVGQAIAAELRTMRSDLDSWLDVDGEERCAQTAVQLSLAILGAGAVSQVLDCAGASLLEAVEAIAAKAEI